MQTTSLISERSHSCATPASSRCLPLQVPLPWLSTARISCTLSGRPYCSTRTYAVSAAKLLQPCLAASRPSGPQSAIGKSGKAGFGTGGRRQLKQPLVKHGVGDAAKAGYVGAHDQIRRLSELLGCIPAAHVDIGHDVTQGRVDAILAPLGPDRKSAVEGTRVEDSGGG